MITSAYYFSCPTVIVNQGTSIRPPVCSYSIPVVTGGTGIALYNTIQYNTKYSTMRIQDILVKGASIDFMLNKQEPHPLFTVSKQALRSTLGSDSYPNCHLGTLYKMDSPCCGEWEQQWCFRVSDFPSVQAHLWSLLLQEVTLLKIWDFLLLLQVKQRGFH